MARRISKEKIETLWAPWRVEYFEKEPRDRDFLETAGRASDDASPSCNHAPEKCVPDDESVSLHGWTPDGGAVSQVS